MPIGIYYRHFWQEAQDRVAADATSALFLIVPYDSQRSQPAGLVAVPKTGLMWANMLRAFQVGKALTSDEGPLS